MHYSCIEHHSCLFGFERVPFLVNGSLEGEMSVVVQLFSNGDVEFQFGVGTSPIPCDFHVGIHSTTFNIYEPIVMNGCTAEGLCKKGEPFPQGKRFRFSCK